LRADAQTSTLDEGYLARVMQRERAAPEVDLHGQEPLHHRGEIALRQDSFQPHAYLQPAWAICDVRGPGMPHSMRHAYQRVRVDRGLIRASQAHFRHARARVFRDARWRTDCSPPRLAKERDMNWEQVEGNWHQFKGQIRSKWGKITDDDMKVLSG